MDKKATIYDIAEKLGISVGTVNRAINNKGRISPETKQKVLDMAQELGFEANPAAQSLRRSPIKIGVILSCPVHQYLDEIKRGIDSALKEIRQYNIYSDIHIFCDTNKDVSSQDIDPIINQFIGGGFKGAILFLSGNNSYAIPMVDKLNRAGIAVATVSNDIEQSSRAISVSVDGRCAGRMAAEILYLCCPQKHIAILTGSGSTTIHKENIAGFTEFSAGSRFTAIDVYEHEDLQDRVVKQIEKITKAGNQYQGLYITSASSVYAQKFLFSSDAGNKLKIVTTDLFCENINLLESETVIATIYQDPYKQGKTAVQKLYKYICGTDPGGQVLLTPLAVFKSNMHSYI
jgi:Transcriptional regulators